LKKKLPFILLFLILAVFSYPNFYYYFIKNKVYKAASTIYFELIEQRRISLQENKNIGFYFNIKENLYIIFEDLNNNNTYDENDILISNNKITDISSNVFLFNLFFDNKTHLNNSTIVFYPDATCSMINTNEDKSIFFIHEKDKEEIYFYRVIRIKFSKDTCDIKISKVLNIYDEVLEFEN
jgi:hypothetical protein